MLFAEQSHQLYIILGIALLIALGVGSLYLYRGYEHYARQALARQYEGLAIHPDRRPGDVILTYHTYHGLIAWVTQTPHQAALPPEDARILLGRLLKFNLQRGLTTYGAVFILPLSILNYYAQRRSIARQESAESDLASIATAAGGDAGALRARPTLFRRIVGWTAAFLSVMFGVCGIVMGTVERKIEGAIGGVVVAIILGAVAKEWLSGRSSG